MKQQQGAISLIAAYLISHYAVCFLFFTLIQKPFFFIYNICNGVDPDGAHSLSTFLGTIAHGYKLDLAAAGYLTLFPLLATIIAAIFSKFPARKVLKVYDIAIAIVLALLTVADASLYTFWNTKIDSSVLTYLATPAEAFASVSAGYIMARFAFIAVIALIAGFMLLLTLRFIPLSTNLSTKSKIIVIAILAIFCAATFTAIRGTQERPYAPAAAFYINVPFLNHTALNPLFNIIYNISRTTVFRTEFRAMDDEQCAVEFAGLFPVDGTPRNLLTTTRPNVVVLIVEGLGAALVESLGGQKGITPNLDRIALQGVNFTHACCGATKTEWGLLCVINGYPGQPTTSLIRYESKVGNLPSIPKTLKEEGYNTTFIYGGNPSYRNFSAYFYASGHDKVIGVDDFPGNISRTSWGVPDHVLLDRVYDELTQAEKSGTPAYMSVLTSSSHSPWDVPETTIADNPELNAYAYTDRSIGRFVDRLQSSPMWQNTLVVIVSDHSQHTLSKTDASYPHIPLIFTGGAVKSPLTIDYVVSQTDIAATLLGQMQMNHSKFIFSRDVLADTYTDRFAFFIYENGFSIIDSLGTTTYDNVAQKAMAGDNATRIHRGKVILQTLYNDMADR